MKITYRKKTGEVVMVGVEVNNEALETVELPYDLRIHQGYLMTYKDNTLEFKLSSTQENEQIRENQRKKYLEDLDKINKAKNVDEIKDLLVEISGKIYNQ